MASSDGTAPEVVAFSRQLAATVQDCSDGLLVGTYLHGSAAWGGWLASRSDVDLLLVLADTATVEHLAAVEQALTANAALCPGTGLECSVVSSAHASTPAPPWPFLLHVQASHGQPLRCISGESLDGDPDLLMHYAVCRAAGLAVLGPEAHSVFGPVPRDDVLAYLAGELGWGIEHGSEAYAVLNACRALVYATNGEIVSKVEGGRRALEEGWAPADLVTRALGQQQAFLSPQPVAPDAAAFVRLARDRVLSQR